MPSDIGGWFGKFNLTEISSDLSFPTLDEEILDSMCMMSCRQSLVDLRLKIQLACEMDKRPFVYKHIEFPRKKSGASPLFTEIN